MSLELVQSLDHLVVAVEDLAAATSDYGTILGRLPSWCGEHPGQGSANTLFRLANTYVELLAPQGQGVIGDLLRQRLAAVGPGPVALAFGTADIARFASAMCEAGRSVPDAVDGSGRDSRTGEVRTWRSIWLPQDLTRGVQTMAIQHLEGALPEAACYDHDGSDAASCVDRVDHVVVMSGNVDAAREVYGGILGLRLALDRSFEQRGVRLLFFRVGGVTVEIGGKIEEDQGAVDEPDNFWGVAFGVPDADATRQRLDRTGFEVSEVRAGHKKGTRVFTIGARTHGVATLMIGPDRG